MLDQDDTRIGERFQTATAYARGDLRGGRLDLSSMPPRYKSYVGSPRVELPAPAQDGGPPLWRAMSDRRSIRDYQPDAITLEQLGQVLWAATGLALSYERTGLRTAPSAGALYPIETYVAAHAVGGLDPGIWHYDIRAHTLELVRAGNVRLPVAHAALDQSIAAEANAVFMWSAVFARTTWKYRQRGYRYMYMEVGHIAQNAALAATGLGLATCQIAAIFDDEANALIGVDGHDESVIYLSTLARET